MLQLEQLAGDPLVSLSRVVSGHPRDQLCDRVVDRWSPGSMRVGPLLGHEAAMPPHNRGGGDQL
jgi:hypothetical protein